MKITFNTGRQYTREGQIVTADYDPDARTITFMDHSRLIAGFITDFSPFASLEPLPELLAAVTMRHYDAGDYAMSVHMPERLDTVHQFRL